VRARPGNNFWTKWWALT